MDPLSILREYTVQGELANVVLVGDEYQFGDDYRFPRNLETAYRSKQGSLYTLDSLVYFVKNTNLKHTEYMQQARSLKLQIVTFTDRKPLQDYLEGKVTTTDAIELLAPGGVPNREDRYGGQAEEENDANRGDESVAHTKRLRSEYEGQEYDGREHNLEASGRNIIDSIRERERRIRDRESILLCHNKNFSGVLGLLTRREEEKRKEVAEQKRIPDKVVEAPKPPPNPSSRYVNVEEKRFWKEHLGTDAAEELGIDPSQSYIADPNKQQDSTKLGPDPRAMRPSQNPHQRPSASAARSKTDGPPIILVPSASQTLLNTYNAKEFLEDGVYISPELKAKSMAKKPELLSILRKMGREHPVKYEVRDKPTALSAKDWDRVVAVFVLGKEWQFKDWPFKEHVEIFNKMMGVFLRFEDDSVESAKVVKQWNVKILSLSKHKRHQDRTAVLTFWDSLDKAIRARKLNLVF